MPVQAGEAELQQQIEALQQRVTELEKRLDALQSPEVMEMVEKMSKPTHPGDSSDLSNWSRLNVGFDYYEVRDLLGEPQSVKKGGMEFWFYSDRGMKGPYVKFLFRKLNDWKAPESK